MDYCRGQSQKRSHLLSWNRWKTSACFDWLSSKDVIFVFSLKRQEKKFINIKVRKMSVLSFTYLYFFSGQKRLKLKFSKFECKSKSSSIKQLYIKLGSKWKLREEKSLFWVKLVIWFFLSKMTIRELRSESSRSSCS